MVEKRRGERAAWKREERERESKKKKKIEGFQGVPNK